jgi:hypothetical protein
MKVVFFDVVGVLVVGDDVEEIFKDPSMLASWNCVVLKNIAEDSGATLVARSSPFTAAELTAAVGLPVTIADPVDYLDNNTVDTFVLIVSSDEIGPNYLVDWRFGVTPTDAVKVKKWLDTGHP